MFELTRDYKGKFLRLFEESENSEILQKEISSRCIFLSILPNRFQRSFRSETQSQLIYTHR